MQGFFSKPVDNLYAEPLIARWVKHNVVNWKEAVVVSKNPGGTKRYVGVINAGHTVSDNPSRVTSLADALKLNFALITTDRRRANYDVLSSKFHSTRHSPAGSVHGDHEGIAEPLTDRLGVQSQVFVDGEGIDRSSGIVSVHYPSSSMGPPSIDIHPEPSLPIGDLHISAEIPLPVSTASTEYNYHLPPHPEDDFDEEYTDDNARDVTYGRLVQGHVVDDDYTSVPPSVRDEEEDINAGSSHMVNSIYSITSSNDHALGGAVDTNETDDEEEVDVNSAQERMITLVGHVRDRTVLLVDDMIDRPGSWIAAAEHCAKRAGAKKVYCIATHGVFGGECLEEMEACSYIDYVCRRTHWYAFCDFLLIITFLDHCHQFLPYSREENHSQSEVAYTRPFYVAI